MKPIELGIISLIRVPIQILSEYFCAKITTCN